MSSHIRLNGVNSHKDKLCVFKSPVLRSDWLTGLRTRAPMLRHSTSGSKVSRAGWGRNAKLEELTNQRGRDLNAAPRLDESLVKQHSAGVA